MYSEVALSDIKTVTLDYQSKSSVTLIKILNKFFWKQDFEFEEAKPGYEKNILGNRAAVVIGDRTFSLNGNFKFEYDLADEWKKFTGLPFVFAAWICNSDMDDQFVIDFNTALKHGLLNIDAAIKESKENYPSQFSPTDYLKNKIDYNLDRDKMKAIELFLSYIKQL